MTRSKILLSAVLTLSLSSVAVSMSALGATPDQSQAPNIVEDLMSKGNVSITQPDNMNDKLVFDSVAARETQKNTTRQQASSSRQGYRVEVFADNNPRTAKQTASAKKRNLESRFRQYPVYMVFESPYWRVRLGDFKSRAEAEAAMREVRSAFPAYANDLRIVRSTIK
jgi:hypothetical protein